jgi:hypothetical protein
MVRKSNPELTTLAIGYIILYNSKLNKLKKKKNSDGANDVNMINEAHVGIGIKGLEG